MRADMFMTVKWSGPISEPSSSHDKGADTAAPGEPLVLAMNGIYDLTKTASQAWTVGQLIYWDVATSRVTNVVATNKLVGVAVLAVGAGAGEIVGRVRLTAASAN